jgi:hypothetical protein
MSAAAKRKRNSRWDDAPVLDRRGAPKVAATTEHDIERIFKPLCRYRYLPADYLPALGGGNLGYVIDRLYLLSRRPNLYVARPLQQRANANANHRHLIYELADKGARVMQERGFEYQRTRSPASFAHELMVCQIMASFELGTRVTNARIITWDDILRSKRLPETTRRSAKPYHIPVSITVDGHVIDTHVAADGHPFGVASIVDDHLEYFFCPGIEADCGTEPMDASDFARSSIYKKFVLYLAVEAQGIHRLHFGFPNFYVPVITTNETRARSMMDLLSRITAGKGSKIFLFKTFPAFTSFEKPDPASAGCSPRTGSGSVIPRSTSSRPDRSNDGRQAADSRYRRGAGAFDQLPPHPRARHRLPQSQRAGTLTLRNVRLRRPGIARGPRRAHPRAGIRHHPRRGRADR